MPINLSATFVDSGKPLKYINICAGNTIAENLSAMVASKKLLTKEKEKEDFRRFLVQRQRHY